MVSQDSILVLVCQMLALLDDNGLVSSLEGRGQAILAHMQPEEPSLSLSQSIG